MIQINLQQKLKQFPEFLTCSFILPSLRYQIFVDCMASGCKNCKLACLCVYFSLGVRGKVPYEGEDVWTQRTSPGKNICWV